jgi:hypothetical protein
MTADEDDSMAKRKVRCHGTVASVIEVDAVFAVAVRSQAI